MLLLSRWMDNCTCLIFDDIAGQWYWQGQFYYWDIGQNLKSTKLHYNSLGAIRYQMSVVRILEKTYHKWLGQNIIILAPLNSHRAHINSVAPGRCGCNLKIIWYFFISSFKTYIKDRYTRHFLWNCPQENATRPYGYKVNINSYNGLITWANFDPHLCLHIV